MQDSRDGSGREGVKGGQIIRIEEEHLSRHLNDVVRGTVEETLNALLDAEADQVMPGQALRAHRGPQRHAGGPLHQEAAHDGGRGGVKGSQSAHAAL